MGGAPRRFVKAGGLVLRQSTFAPTQLRGTGLTHPLPELSAVAANLAPTTPLAVINWGLDA